MVNLQDKLSHHGCHYIVSELIAGGFAGVFGWVTATPLDVVKSRIQASEGKVKLVPVIKELYREEGKSYIVCMLCMYCMLYWLICQMVYFPKLVNRYFGSYASNMPNSYHGSQ